MSQSKSPGPMIVLHHLVDSRSERIFWALEELDLPYTVVVHQRSRFGGATRSLGEMTESGKAPSVQLDNEWLSESAYIIHRLLALARERQGRPISNITALLPQQVKQSLLTGTEASPAGIGAASHVIKSPSAASRSSAGTSEVDVELSPSDSSTYYAHWAEGSLMLWMQAFLLHRMTANQLISGRLDVKGAKPTAEMVLGMKEWSKWAGGVIYAPGTQRNIDAMEPFIKDHTFFSGTTRPGIGDFMVAYPMSTLIHEDQGKKAPYKIGPGLKSWMARIRARPAYQRAMQRLKAEEEAQRPPPTAKL